MAARGKKTCTGMVLSANTYRKYQIDLMFGPLLSCLYLVTAHVSFHVKYRDPLDVGAFCLPKGTLPATVSRVGSSLGVQACAGGARLAYASASGCSNNSQHFSCAFRQRRRGLDKTRTSIAASVFDLQAEANPPSLSSPFPPGGRPTLGPGGHPSLVYSYLRSMHNSLDTPGAYGAEPAWRA